jgi:hypothetical protein
MIAHTLIIILVRVDRHLGYIKKLRSAAQSPISKKIPSAFWDSATRHRTQNFTTTDGIATKLVTRVQRLSWTALSAEQVRRSGCGMRAVLYDDEQRVGGARERFLRTTVGDRRPTQRVR